MTFKARALVAAFLITAAAPVPALAAQKKPAAEAPKGPTASKEAVGALQALQKAAVEKRNADVPGLLQAALAVAKTNEDRYLAYRLSTPSFIDTKNDPGLLTALEGMIATGIPTGADLNNFAVNAARMNYNNKNDAKAATYIAQAIAAAPNDPEAYAVRAELNNRQGKPNDAVADFQKAIQLTRAAGKPVDPALSRRTLAIAYNNKLPIAKDLAFAQLKAEPSTDNWRNAIKLADQLGNYQSNDKIDLYRLQRATGSLVGEGDYFPYVDTLLVRGLPSEAKSVMDEAFAAGKLDKSKQLWRETYNSAVTRDAADKTAPNADVYLGRGDYAKAAAGYRATVAKGGAGVDVANLRLGIALARAGDKAGATAALNAVQGQRAGIAQMWLLYLQTKA